LILLCLLSCICLFQCKKTHQYPYQIPNADIELPDNLCVMRMQLNYLSPNGVVVLDSQIVLDVPMLAELKNLKNWEWTDDCLCVEQMHIKLYTKSDSIIMDALFLGNNPSIVRFHDLKGQYIVKSIPKKLSSEINALYASFKNGLKWKRALATIGK